MSSGDFSPKAVLVTGGAGFIGSNFVRFVLSNWDDVRVINLDGLTYAGNLENLADVAGDPRYTLEKLDICETEAVIEICRKHGVDSIIHFAAESHVDRSIVGPREFVRTNVDGTLSLLQAARSCGDLRFLQIGTDEVYGSLGPTGQFTETTPLDPHSPYSASKAAADHLVSAFGTTYGLPVLITRCSNNYGPYQFPEKMIPLMINNARQDKPLPVYGDGANVRDWIYVEDHCRALWTVLINGQPGRVYNIGGNSERANLDVVKTILRHLGKPESLITFVKDRPGHDFRYAIDSSRIHKELGWEPAVDFDTGLKHTIQWYLNHLDWLDHIVTGAYQKYYEEMYAGR
ncbi:MAG: dTDP-glucose 4,6-dehydratase [Phycisphaerales bacterium]|nr:dTDP-glucose 4,6-dehydratase [Phycisphaerales bacterium]